MTLTRTRALTAAILTAFVLLMVGGPYTYLIVKACQPTGVGDFFSDVRAFHTKAGC